MKLNFQKLEIFSFCLLKYKVNIMYRADSYILWDIFIQIT